jgi:hypothetical protein
MKMKFRTDRKQNLFNIIETQFENNNLTLENNEELIKNVVGELERNGFTDDKKRLAKLLGYFIELNNERSLGDKNIFVKKITDDLINFGGLNHV